MPVTLFNPMPFDTVYSLFIYIFRNHDPKKIDKLIALYSKLNEHQDVLNNNVAFTHYYQIGESFNRIV